jgi:cysteine desulfurase / selenocysteine lyase
MSTNTTNTNNGTSNGAVRPKSNAAKSAAEPGGGAQRFPFASIPLPDPALLERLANEFFLVLPEDLANGNGDSTPAHSPNGDADEIPTTMFSEPLPLHESGGTKPAMSASMSPPQPGPLTEKDLQAIAASLAGETALVPGGHSTAPGSTAPLPPDILAGGSPSPIALAPTLPPGNEVFAFPGVVGMLSPTPTGPPSGSDANAVPQSPGNVAVIPGSTPYLAEGAKGGSPGTPSMLPVANDLFSFPRVPAMPIVVGAETVPNSPTLSSPSMVAPLGTEHSIAAPSVIDTQRATGSAPDVQATPITDTAKTNPAIPSGLSSAEKGVYPGASLPSSSEMFSFQGVPGVRSAPAFPALALSEPTTLPSPTDLSGSSAIPGASAPLTQAPVRSPKTPSEPGASNPGSAGEVSQFEFRPDVIPDLGVAKRPLDPRLIRCDFPILEERVHGRPLIWLDNAATTQKPNAVIDRLSYFYRHENSNIHRAAHDLAARATDAYESAREKARRFLNASSTREIVFVRGTTEGINLIAQSWGRRNVQKDDEIVITWLEHHANIVPWQQLCSEKGARLRVAPVNDRGEVILEEYEKLLGPRTRIVSFSQVSNALGTITPAREMVEMAHRHGARVLVDGAQAVSHMRVDVQDLDCDFYVFSGHKVFGPTGIGVVYGKTDVLENTPPWQGGGNMIVDVTFEKTTYQPAPARFEAGTGNIADAVGLGAALDYVEQVGMEAISAYEHDLLNYGTAGLLTVPGLRLIGTAHEKAGVLSFVLDEMRTEDVGVALNEEGIAVRSGHHCAQPILRRMGVESTVRPSLAFYNTCEELDQLVAALLRIQADRNRGRKL